MPLPKVRPGLVFRYEYVWKRQSLTGRDVGEKDRPVCCVAVAVSTIDGSQRILIVPITTQPPDPSVPALEIPMAVKSHLGLDGDRRSWIILNEANVDSWPTPDMRQVPGKPGCFEYGVLPLKMVNMIWETVFPELAAKRLGVVTRDEEDAPPRPTGWGPE
ncbi:hypothetical protein [Telmatospirillum sp.]|uniref:hypothetical protein n=1 Tax=Telmatospirillum sp. TaxID=2079197 RepID=UPI0028401503|nr:hypothetical protein [Telmatospirillum sp.]MDR3440889.1 hypothetical protein [Telmatospirillum sp.]